jgi:DNA-binding MarR family transcriptional regulator
VATRHPQLEEQAVLAILRKADQLLLRIADTLKPYALSITQYNVLRILRGAGEGGASAKEIAGRLVSRDPDITRLMDRLEKRGLLSRERSPEDRRSVTHRLTRDGLTLVNQLDEPMHALHKATLRGLTHDKLRTLIAILEEIRIQP